MAKRHSILYVEDDAFLRLIVQRVLGEEFELVIFPNGLEAMAWLETGQQPHIILTDLWMPLLNGQDLIRLVRSSSFHQHIPIIVLSSNEDSSLKVACLDQGADDFMIKPFDPLELQAKIRAVLRRTVDRYSFRPGYDVSRISQFQ